MQALILAGGSGTRFWPLSRRRRPKQLLALEGGRSLLQATVDRLAPLIGPDSVWICTTALIEDAVREQLPEVPAEQILVEPEGRNTAPAIGWSLRTMPEALRQGVVAVLPADHRFADPDAFRQTLALAETAALTEDRVLTLGVEPRWAETGYGYLELGRELTAVPGLRELASFKEKPSAATAAGYLRQGGYLWNAGVFVFRGETLLRHLARFEPEIGAGLEAIAGEPERVGEIYPTLPRVSIDYGVMERLEGIATLPLGGGWSDLGSWEALAEVLQPDAGGNKGGADLLTIDARDNLVWAETGTVALIGVEGLAVVRTEDALLVVPKARSQEVKGIVEALEGQRRKELL